MFTKINRDTRRFSRWRFNLGQILLRTIDLRTKFERNLYNLDLLKSACVPEHLFNTLIMIKKCLIFETLKNGRWKSEECTSFNPTLLRDVCLRERYELLQRKEILWTRLCTVAICMNDYKASEIDFIREERRNWKLLGGQAIVRIFPNSREWSFTRVDWFLWSFKDDKIDEEHIALSDSVHESYQQNSTCFDVSEVNGPCEICYWSTSISWTWAVFIENTFRMNSWVCSRNNRKTRNWWGRILPLILDFRKKSRKESPAEHVNERQDHRKDSEFW